MPRFGPTAQELDVLVLGAGPAGATAAACLAPHCRVALVGGRAVHAGPAIGESLPASARTALADLGVWQIFQSGGHLPAWTRQSLWGSDQPSMQDAIFDPHGHGWHLDRPRFDAMLRTLARERGAHLTHPAQVRRLHCAPEGGHYPWHCEMETADGPWMVRCRFVVDATGRSARVARQAGAQLQRQDRLVCLHTWLQGGAEVPAGSTLIEAAADGWWYSADLPGGTRVIAWHGDGDLASVQGCRTAGDLLERARRTQLIGRHCPPAAQALVPLRAAPANGQWPSQAAGSHWLAVGDASLAFDPLASQGLLHGLVTGQMGALAVREHLGGNAQALPAWNRQLQQVAQAYRDNRARYYAMEQRWPNEPFWQRRSAQQPVGVASAMH